jgi:hypothetical protein
VDVREKEWDEAICPTQPSFLGDSWKAVSKPFPKREARHRLLRRRSAVRHAAKTLQDLGYKDVVCNRLRQWKSGHAFRCSEANRTGWRVIASSENSEVGEAGQLKLLASKILLVGAGGLGSRPESTLQLPAWAHSVLSQRHRDESNLQHRFSTGRLRWALPKSILLGTLFEETGCESEAYNLRLDASNVLDIFKD